jgi:large-conductance mechanosensitive channel
MQKHLVSKAMNLPGWLVAVCFALWLAAHSFLVFMFVSFAVFLWIKRSIKATMREEKVEETKGTAHTVAAPTPADVNIMPIKRQYAKSAVVVPFKTGTDD